MDKLFYSSEDLEEIEEENNQILEYMDQLEMMGMDQDDDEEEEDDENDDDVSFCCRGLECRTGRGSIILLSRYKKITKAVLNEQERQRRYGIDDPLLIAQACQAVSQRGANEAHQRGLKYAKETQPSEIPVFQPQPSRDSHQKYTSSLSFSHHERFSSLCDDYQGHHTDDDQSSCCNSDDEFSGSEDGSSSVKSFEKRSTHVHTSQSMENILPSQRMFQFAAIAV